MRFSMDDFRTGFSSLDYLTQLPLSQLKIDQSFIRNINIKQTDAVIEQTIIWILTRTLIPPIFGAITVVKTSGDSGYLFHS